MGKVIDLLGSLYNAMNLNLLMSIFMFGQTKNMLS